MATKSPVPASSRRSPGLGLAGKEARAEFGSPGRFLMLVKTYPIPSSSHDEVVCCAGLDAETRQWVRMYPVNFRTLGASAKFKKWQFIYATWSSPRSDSRPESRRVHQDSIRAGEWLDPSHSWRKRRPWMDGLLDDSVEALVEAQWTTRRSLGMVRPARIDRLEIRPAKGWTDAANANLAQLSLGWGGPTSSPSDLEKIPFDFIYHFTCRDNECRGHEMEIFDWEAGQAYRRFVRRYGKDGWESHFRQKWEVELPSRDLHLILGTHHQWQTWMIVGVLYPPDIEVPKVDRRSRGDRRGEQGTMTLPGFGLEAE